MDTDDGDDDDGGYGTVAVFLSHHKGVCLKKLLAILLSIFGG